MMFILGAFTVAFVWLVWEILRYKEALRIEKRVNERYKTFLEEGTSHV